MSEEVTPEPAADQAPEPTPPPERDFINEAKNLGWHDPSDEDFRGDPEKALSAEEFVKRGEEQLPILKANIRKVQNELNEEKLARKEYKDFMESQIAAQKEELERAKRQAVEDGDIEKYDELKKKTIDVAKPEVPHPDVVDAVRDFQSRNTWYGVDERMTQYAEFIDNQLAMKGLTLTPEQHFKKVEEAVMMQFPHKKPVRQAGPSSVEPARKRPSGKPSQTYEAMPQESKQACNRMVKKYGVSKDDFVKNYWKTQEK